MVKPQVIIFLILSSIFAGVHYMAMTASLYWYYSWFDIVMHFWGGLLIGLGVHAMTTFSFVRVRPTTLVVFVVILVTVVSWEVFEWIYGLYDPATHLIDTSSDIMLGFSGGLLAHFVLANRYNRSI